MKNLTLNAGGIIGALACGAVAAAVIFSSYDTANDDRAPYKLIVVAVIAGAFGGNFLWGLITKKS